VNEETIVLPARRARLVLAAPLAALALAARGSSGSSAAAAAGPCTTADLGFSLGTIDHQQDRVPIVATNRSAKPCTLRGYPDIEFVARDGTTEGVVTSTIVPVTPINLAPGQAAQAVLQFLPFGPDTPSTEIKLDVTSLRVTPPGAKNPAILPWADGPLQDQGGATHPATYIMAFERR